MSSGRRRNNPPRVPCLHNVYIKGLCGNCGVRLEPPQSTNSVSMIHSVPDLKVSHDLARIIGKDDQLRLIKDRKLVLLVDLDQTLLHTTHEDIKNDPNVESFTLWSGHPTYHTKFRPHLKLFLDEMLTMYELHIFTFGCRKYAHKIASLIDPDQKYFGNRILSRDESVDQFSKRGNLNNLFPCGDAMVCIIDDRSDVWQNAGNLIQVKPYSYFKTSISDGAGQQYDDISAEAEESLKKEVDELEALLGLGSSDNNTNLSANDKEESIESQENDEEIDVVNKSGGDIDDVGQESPDNQDSEKTNSKRALSHDDDTEDGLSESPTKKFKNSILEDDSEKSGSESPVEDTDEHLLDLIKILKRVYDKWYMELDEEIRYLTPEEVEGIAYKLPDIKDIIRKYFRKKF